MLIHLGAAYSESISVLVDSVHEFPRHSNPNFEVKVLNDSAFNSKGNNDKVDDLLKSYGLNR